MTIGLIFGYENKDILYETMNLNISNAINYYFEDDEDSMTLDEWKKVNEDVCGLLKFKGMKYDYSIPIVYTSNIKYYSNHNAFKKYDYLGSTYIAKQISPIDDSPNIIIIGNSDSSKNYGMSAVRNFENENYFGSKYTFVVETANQRHVFLVVASALFKKNDDILYKWYDNKIDSMEKLRNLLNLSQDKIIQGTDTITYSGEQLATIITCDEKDNCHVVIGIEKPSF